MAAFDNPSTAPTSEPESTAAESSRSSEEPDAAAESYNIIKLVYTKYIGYIKI